MRAIGTGRYLRHEDQVKTGTGYAVEPNKFGICAHEYVSVLIVTVTVCDGTIYYVTLCYSMIGYVSSVRYVKEA